MHLEVIAPENDGDDVFTNVVDVSLHCRHEDDAGVRLLDHLALGRGQPLLLLHEGDEMCDGLLHDTRALDDLRQEHFARTEQVSDDVHSVHQRALDDL